MKHSKLSDDESCIEKFLKAINIGPVCVCVVCNRCLYKSNVVLCYKEKYNFEHIGRLVTIITFVEHVILKLRNPKFHVKQFIISCIRRFSQRNIMFESFRTIFNF